MSATDNSGLPQKTPTIATQTQTQRRVTIRTVALAISLLTLVAGGTFLYLNVAAKPPNASNSVTLLWTAPGDDDNIGQALRYDIRYANTPITAESFDLATAVTNPPAPQTAGSSETYTVINLQAAKSYYFALKSIDESGNVSAMSNVVTKETAARNSGGRKK